MVPLAVVTLGAVTGCQPTIRTPELERLSPTPIPVDEAMRQRDWGYSIAYYRNGAVVAGPTGFPFEPVDETPKAHSVFLEPAMFIAQSAMLPVHLLTPPWAPVTHHGTLFGPTYHAQPPLE